MKTLFLSILALASTLTAWSQRFDDEFDNRTLRIDYTFAGNVNKQDISVAKLNVMPGWFGKRQRLAEVPVEGNGQITVRRKKDKQVIYRNSFCTLFQEWLTYDEAKTSSKSFENVFLVPMPKDTVEITVDLRNNRREVVASLTHTVAPKDILIRKVGQSAVTPYEVLQKAADPNRCIHIAYVAEGYTEAEMDVFLKDAKEATEALFAHEPFKSTRERFNIVAVKSPSKESGTSEPSKGIWKNTALHSHFDTFYSDRYLTTLVNFKGKWENLIKKNTPIPTPATEKNKKTVGVYEGGGYSLKGVYRGFQDCRMRTNEFPEFCPVCTQALTRFIDFYTK